MVERITDRERKIIGEDIMTVQFHWPLSMPLVDSLGSGLWEIRTQAADAIARTLFFVKDEELILRHGFIKKTQNTPPGDRALALQRKNAYIKISKEQE